MGSLLSPISANIFMEEFKRDALALAEFKPKVWWRYVDDTFVVFPHGDSKLKDFFELLNSVPPSIRLTMEEEAQNKLSFLDVWVEKDRDVLWTKVFRKKTHTGQYLNFLLNHQKTVKEQVAYSLFDRARSLCSDKDDQKVEMNRIEHDLVKNEYPLSIINKCNKVRDHISKESNNDSRPIAFISIPYVLALSEK